MSGVKAIKDCLKQNHSGHIFLSQVKSSEVPWCGYSPRCNESFKASIITQEITTQGYTVMAPFCWNLFIIWFLSTLLFKDAQTSPALSLVINSSRWLGLSSDWSVLFLLACLAIMFNEETHHRHCQLTETSVTLTLQFSPTVSSDQSEPRGASGWQKRCLHLLR